MAKRGGKARTVWGKWPSVGERQELHKNPSSASTVWGIIYIYMYIYICYLAVFADSANARVAHVFCLMHTRDSRVSCHVHPACGEGVAL